MKNQLVQYIETTRGFSIIYEESGDFKSSCMDYAIFTSENEDDASMNFDISSPRLVVRHTDASKDDFLTTRISNYDYSHRMSIKAKIKKTEISDKKKKTRKRRFKNFFPGLRL